MRSPIAGRLLLVGAVLALPVSGYAQDATLSGTFTDANYGQPIPILSIAYQPRMLQLGFRMTF